MQLRLCLTSVTCILSVWLLPLTWQCLTLLCLNLVRATFTGFLGVVQRFLKVWCIGDAAQCFVSCAGQNIGRMLKIMCVNSRKHIEIPSQCIFTAGLGLARKILGPTPEIVVASVASVVCQPTRNWLNAVTYSVQMSYIGRKYAPDQFGVATGFKSRSQVVLQSRSSWVPIPTKTLYFVGSLKILYRIPYLKVGSGWYWLV